MWNRPVRWTRLSGFRSSGVAISVAQDFVTGRYSLTNQPGLVPQMVNQKRPGDFVLWRLPVHTTERDIRSAILDSSQQPASIFLSEPGYDASPELMLAIMTKLCR